MKKKKIRNRSIMGACSITGAGAPFATLYGLQSTGNLPHFGDEAILGCSLGIGIVIGLIAFVLSYLLFGRVDDKSAHKGDMAEIKEKLGMVDLTTSTKALIAEKKAKEQAYNRRIFSHKRYEKQAKHKD